MSLRLLYLIFIRLVGWLVLLARTTAAKDAEALHRTTQPLALFTLGSPLGRCTIIYERLRPTTAAGPARRNPVGQPHRPRRPHRRPLRSVPVFPPASGCTVTPSTPPEVDNGTKPHDTTHYLAKRATSGIVAAQTGHNDVGTA